MEFTLDSERSLMLFDKIYLENLKERKIILNSEIDSTVIEMVCMQIKKFNYEDKDIPIEDRKPIEVYVTSYGGSVYDGFAVVNAIITSKTPVYTFCEGYAMSMGLAIFIAGHKRFSYPFTNFMYHEISTGVFGKNEEIERVATENKRLQKMYDLLVVSNTNLTQKKLDSIRKSTKDWNFGSEDALKFGVVHEIIQ